MVQQDLALVPQVCAVGLVLELLFVYAFEGEEFGGELLPDEHYFAHEAFSDDFNDLIGVQGTTVEMYLTVVAVL